MTTANLRRTTSLGANASVATVARVLDAVPEAIVLVGSDRRIVHANRKLERLCGYRRGELNGMVIEDLMLEPSQGSGAHTCMRKGGACFPATVQVASMGIEGDEFAVCTIRDDSERWHTEEQLAAKAMRDPLTGLPNRTLLMDRLEQALQRMRRATGLVALLYVDLDWFKEINDEFGHLTGDAVLRDVAVRLRTAVRPSDTVARLGGDEFVILCDPVTSAPTAYEIAQRVLRALSETITVDSQEMALSASVGVALSWGPRTTSRALLHAADTSLYRAKRAGKGRCELAPAHKRGA